MAGTQPKSRDGFLAWMEEPETDNKGNVKLDGHNRTSPNVGERIRAHASDLCEQIANSEPIEIEFTVRAAQPGAKDSGQCNVPSRMPKSAEPGNAPTISVHDGNYRDPPDILYAETNPIPVLERMARSENSTKEQLTAYQTFNLGLIPDECFANTGAMKRWYYSKLLVQLKKQKAVSLFTRPQQAMRLATELQGPVLYNSLQGHHVSIFRAMYRYVVGKDPEQIRAEQLKKMVKEQTLMGNNTESHEDHMRVDLGVEDDGPVLEVVAPGSTEDKNAEESSMESDAEDGAAPVVAVKKRPSIDEEDEMPHKERVPSKKLKQAGLGAFFSSPSKPPAPHSPHSYSFSPSPYSICTEPAAEPEAQAAAAPVAAPVAARLQMEDRTLTDPPIEQRTHNVRAHTCTNNEKVHVDAPMIKRIQDMFSQRSFYLNTQETLKANGTTARLDLALVVDGDHGRNVVIIEDKYTKISDAFGQAASTYPIHLEEDTNSSFAAEWRSAPPNRRISIIALPDDTVGAEWMVRKLRKKHENDFRLELFVLNTMTDEDLKAMILGDQE
jgi:hypothetical protein